MSELVIPYALEVLNRELLELQEKMGVDLAEERTDRLKELTRQLILAMLYLETEIKKAGEKV